MPIVDDHGRVRLLINDIVDDVAHAADAAKVQIFTDDEIDAFIDMEGGSVKRAAAQALDTIADDEALRSKVITTQDVQVDGAKLADSLRSRAKSLRDQASQTDGDSGSSSAFFISGFQPACPGVPELTEHPYGYRGSWW